ncbi:uncharacterized protein LOC110239841 [Exaiptasia diaphana]|uniref:F-box domain-containing protein n=1 Tax=Exaiptasia diaphana TaxID=2652724 RepID=A0A913X9Z8_EXADI|nr:uncharacterized protein LOC110239841 [Exaiptasia diaphana]
MNKVGTSVFGCFPNEIIVQILSYIHPIYSNLLRLRLVCRKWKILIEKTTYLWRHIHLDDDKDWKPNQDEKYTLVLRVCLEKFGRFIRCVRAEEQKYCYDNQIRELLLSLTNLQKLDVPVLLWTRSYAERMKQAFGSKIKHVTIDDCKIYDSDNMTRQEIKKAVTRGLEAWDLRFIYSWFPNLEVLCLHTSVHKIARKSMVSILNPLKLKELHLELTPYSIKGRPRRRRIEPYPVYEIMNSKHSSLLTSLELRYLILTSKDLMILTERLKGLRNLVVGSISSKNTESDFNTSLCLKSSSLRVVFLSSLPSSWTTYIKLVMPVLEVLVIAQCMDLTALTIEANSLLTLVLRDNFSLCCINAKCESLTDIQIEDCNEFTWQKFKDLLKVCPFVARIELYTEWSSILLTADDCPELQKLIIRGLNFDMCRVNIDCPTLEIFKCIGHCVPSKRQRNSKSTALDILLSCRHLRKMNINDVFYLEKLVINCQTVDMIAVSGRSLVSKPLNVTVNASNKVGEISLLEQSVSTVSVNSPSMGEFILNDCCLAGDNKCRLKFHCENIQAMRVINCSSVKRFSLRVPHLDSLTIDSCPNMSDLDVISDWSTVRQIRIMNCPQLNKAS